MVPTLYAMLRILRFFAIDSDKALSADSEYRNLSVEYMAQNPQSQLYNIWKNKNIFDCHYHVNSPMIDITLIETFITQLFKRRRFRYFHVSYLATTYLFVVLY